MGKIRCVECNQPTLKRLKDGVKKDMYSCQSCGNIFTLPWEIAALQSKIGKVWDAGSGKYQNVTIGKGNMAVGKDPNNTGGK